MEPSEETQAMAEVVKRLKTRYPRALGSAIEELVSQIHHQFDGKPIRNFVPVLVEREAVERLAQTHDQKMSVSA